MPDGHANFAYSLVATAPSPATSGTSLVVTAASGALFPAVPFNVTIWPTGVQPTAANAEIARVTARSTDTFTITRAQEGTTARTVVVGDQIAATITAKTLTDIETGLPSVLRVASVGPRAQPADQGISTSGTITGDNTKVQHMAPSAIVEVRFAYGNWYNNAGVETEGPNDITVSASIEYPATTFLKLYFNGQRTQLIKPGGTVWTDWIAIQVPALTAFWSRTYVSIANNTMKFPLAGSYSSALLEGSTNSAGETDKTTTGTLTGGGFGYGPYAMQARYLAAGSLRVAGVGDSRINGFGDTDTFNGWFGRSFHQGLAYNQRIGYQTEKASVFATNANAQRRLTLLEGCNVAIVDYGVNDLAASRTALQVETDLVTIYRWLQSRGMIIYGCTIEPQTTSTDSWATTANQTLAAWNTARVTFNNWMRDGAPLTSTTNFTPVATGTGGTTIRAGSAFHPLYSYIELADAAESARDSGKWKVTGAANYATTDGLHQSAAIHILQAAVVPSIATLTALAVLSDF